ncbi:MAG: LptF/LptG family permease [Cryomorphaceae bacterium]|nr:LptF/LptG family permease [Cryomorphaceae bacterium]
MFTIIDRYILLKFLGTFILVMILIMSIAVVFDVSEKIEDFITKDAPLKEIIFDFYLNFVLYYGNLFSSMIVFISTILFTSQMANRTEIVAILTGGVGFIRMLWPYLIGATIVASGSYVLNHYFIPQTNETRSEFDNKYIHTVKKTTFRNIHRQVRPGELVFLETFNFQRKTGYRFSFETFDNQVLKTKISSDFIRYDTLTKKWTLDNYVIRTIEDVGVETLHRGKKIDTVLHFLPEDLAPDVYNIETMTTPELKKLIEAEKIRGAESINVFLIQYYSRTSWPAATFVLVLIAVSLSSRKKRGGLGVNIALGLMICVIYIFFMQISTTFATNGNLSPWIAVWIPNFGFSILALYLYYIAPK